MDRVHTAPRVGAVLPFAQDDQLCLVVRYDGTDYHGFQKQPHGPTIQGVLEEVLIKMLGPGQLTGASRTDSGVHAAGQVAIWDGAVGLPIDRIIAVLNRRLPPAIQIVKISWVPRGWDPRRVALAKQYSYRLWRAVGPPDPLWYRMAVPYRRTLSWQRLQESADLFIGTHDFRAFRTEGSSAKTTVRTILVSRWHMEERGHIWRYQVVGDGFLYRMVRHMVASMLLAAAPGGSLEGILEGLSNPGVKRTRLAPGMGLTLDWISF